MLLDIDCLRILFVPEMGLIKRRKTSSAPAGYEIRHQKAKVTDHSGLPVRIFVKVSQFWNGRNCTGSQYNHIINPERLALDFINGEM
jgi:hypothetical protein